MVLNNKGETFTLNLLSYTRICSWLDKDEEVTCYWHGLVGSLPPGQYGIREETLSLLQFLPWTFHGKVILISHYANKLQIICFFFGNLYS